MLRGMLKFYSSIEDLFADTSDSIEAYLTELVAKECSDVDITVVSPDNLFVDTKCYYCDFFLSDGREACEVLRKNKESCKNNTSSKESINKALDVIFEDYERE